MCETNMSNPWPRNKKNRQQDPPLFDYKADIMLGHCSGKFERFRERGRMGRAIEREVRQGKADGTAEGRLEANAVPPDKVKALRVGAFCTEHTLAIDWEDFDDPTERVQAPFRSRLLMIELTSILGADRFVSASARYATNRTSTNAAPARTWSTRGAAHDAFT